MFLFACLIAALLPFSAAQAPAAGEPPNTTKTAQSATTLSYSDAEMAERVRQEFLHAWQGYKQYAWGHDALKPLSKGYHDWYGVPLLMSPVDGLDTMILMGMTDEATQTARVHRQESVVRP